MHLAQRTTLSEQKRQAIVAAAAEMFLRAGYEAASMETIAAAAGVAKQTIYNHFGSKEQLFTAIVDELTHELTGRLPSPGTPSGAPADVLRAVGQQFVAMLLRPSSLALHRMIIAEAQRFPDLARAIYKAGPEVAVARLAAYFRDESARGTLAVQDPQTAAEQFYGMLRGHLQLRALLGVCATPSPGEAAAAVDYAVHTFLRAHAPAAVRC